MDVRKFGLSDDDLTYLGYDVRRGSAAARGDDPIPDAAAAAPLVVTSPVAAGDPARRAWLWTLAILATVGWSASSLRRPPDPVPANRSDAMFSSSRAMSLLVEVARAPRPVGSPEHERVRAAIEARLRALGLDPQLQTATSGVADGGILTAATVRNVVARVKGTASTGAILVTAHYDSTPLSAGAGDDGVGVAAVLETVRAVLAGPPLRNDLIVLFTDGEELGQLGARAFVGAHPWMPDVRLAMVAEMRGLSGPVLVVERVADNGGLVAALARADARPAATSLFRELSPRLPGRTDMDAFAVPGVRVVGFTALGGRASHHQATDRSERVSERTLQHEGQQLLGMTRELGRLDLVGPELTGPPRVYLSLPVAGVIHYPTGWILPIDAALVVAWLIVLFLFRSAAGQPKRAIAGAAMALGAGLLSAAAGWGLLALLRSVHPEYGTVPTAVYHDGYQLAALVALVVTVVVGVYALARPRFGSTALFVGGLAIPLGLAVWLSVSAPFAAPAAQLPLALALMCAAPVAVVAPRDRRGGWAWAGFLAAAAGILFVLVPAVELTADVLTLRAAPLLAAVIAAGLLLLLPTVDWLLRPRTWWAPALSATFAVTLLVLGSPKVQRGWRHPVQTSLAYLVDDTASVDLDASPGPPPAADASDTASTAVRHVLGRWLTVPGAGEEWARSWVAEAAAPGTSPGTLLLPAADRWEVAGSGPGSDLGLPGVRVLSDVVEAGRRHVRLAVRSGLRGEMVGLHVPDGVPAEVVAACDWQAAGAIATEPVRSLAFWGQPDGGEIEVALEVDAHVRSLSLELIEHHLRPTELLGEDFFRREDSLIPDASTGSDRVVQRTLLRLSTRG
jgi:hypothetical protein